jgi:hypothetical protein
MNRNCFLFFIVSAVSAVCLSLSSAAEAPSAKKSAQQELLFSVQVEAAANKAQAQKLEKKLIQKGYPA